MKKENFTINQQKADTLGHKSMIDGVLAGLHYFAKEADVFFKDINQKDECVLGEKRVKIFTRTASSDNDMLIPDEYYRKHPEHEIYITCKIKGGTYSYVGYVTKSVVDSTRIVQMMGNTSRGTSEEIRRIFSEQYLPISDLIELEEEEKEEEIIIPQNYVPLHVHSEFSVGDGFGTVAYLAESYRKKGFKAGALTDHGTMAGVWKFQKTMLERGLKPIIGNEIYVKIPESDKNKHTIILVKNKTGWKNLLKLQALGARDYFHYKPVVPIELLYKYSEGLIVTTACISGPINWLIGEGEIEIAKAYVEKFQSIWGDDFYAEMQPTNVLGNQNIMKIAYNIFKEYGVKMIFTTDSHYPNKEDKEYHEAIKAISWKRDYGDAGYGDDCFHLMTDAEIGTRLETQDNKWMQEHIDTWKQNTLTLTDKIDFKIVPPAEDDTLPKIYPTSEERKRRLKDMCIKGITRKYQYEGKIKGQLDLEIDRILSKNFENYFLLVADLIKWAKDRGIGVGPGRGSVGASLAAYALNITDVDPIEFNLLFDRFLSEIRRDMPDIDMDFQDSRRHEIFQYLKDTYKEEHCARVATYSRFHPKGIMRDIGRIFKIPIKETEGICSLVIERSGGDARSSFGLLDTFAEFEEAKVFKDKHPQATKIAIKLEGHIRHKGIHAAAMVITEKDLSSYAPLTRIGGEIAIEFEKQESEDMKLVKLDILGLKTLSVIAECEKDTKVKPPTTFGHKRVYDEVFKTGMTTGVFQFETVGLSKLSKSLQIDNFHTLYDATTLFRPGALHSGQTMQYVNRHNGKEEIEAAHELLIGITKDTKGIILYQEQIMQIMNQVGGMSWAAAETVRKVITKSKGKKAFEEMRQEFVRNTKKLHNMSKEDSEKLYDVVSTFGSYSFNKVHAVEYSMISYQCAWYKTYFPQAFFKAILKFSNDDVKTRVYLQDAKKNDIDIEYPHINGSQIGYSLYQDKIFSGFDSIKGIGDKTAEKILAGQPYSSFQDFKERCKISKSILHKLIIADSFRDFNINKKEEVTGEEGADYAEAEWTTEIMKSTTLPPKGNFVDAVDFGDYEFTNIEDCNDKTGGESKIIRGLVTDTLNKDKLLKPQIKKHVHKFEYHMVYLNLNDGTGDIAVQINPWTYDKYKNIINSLKNKNLVVYGKLTKDGNKMIGELIEEPDSPKDILNFTGLLNTSEIIITSASPGVSKNDNSYYRLELNNGMKGLSFKSPAKLYPGLKVYATQSKEPFINIQVIK